MWRVLTECLCTFVDPELIIMVNKFFIEILGERARELAWTSLQIKVDTTVDWHTDIKNGGPSVMAVLGKLEKG